MMETREMLTGAALMSVFASAPALACRAAKRKDQAVYSKLIDGHFCACLHELLGASEVLSAFRIG